MASTQTSSTQSQVQRSLRASHSDSNRVSTSPSRTGPFTFQMMEWLVSSMNSTRTCVHCPCKPVLPNTLVTLASLMGCTRLVSMMAARRRSGGEHTPTFIFFYLFFSLYNSVYRNFQNKQIQTDRK